MKAVRALITLAVMLAFPVSGLGQEQQVARRAMVAEAGSFGDLLSGLPQVARYCGTSSFTIDRLAHDVAPVLWLSGREQYMPERLPAIQLSPIKVTRSERPAMYYRVRHLHFLRQGSNTAMAPLAQDWRTGTSALQDGVQAALEYAWSPAELAGLYRIDLRYFFYYWSETGAGAHVNDLESAELKLLLGRDSMGCTSVALWEMFGSAHGLSLSTNSADLSRASGWERDELMPTWVLRLQPGCDGVFGQLRLAGQRLELPTVQQFTNACYYKPVFFVEEGKHASGPDVNQDATLTPVIDLNSSHMDAWGVRDSLGTDSRVSPEYTSEVFVHRIERDMVIPKLGVDDPPLRHPDGTSPWATARLADVLSSRSEIVCRSESEFEQLTLAWSRDPAPGRRPGWRDPKPGGLLKDKGFCDPTGFVVEQKAPGRPQLRGNLYVFRDVGNPYQNSHYLESVDLAIRFDGGTGWTWVPPVAVSPPFVGGWFALKVNGNFTGVDERTIPKSVDVLFMQAATRTFGWYAAAGREWGGDASHRASPQAWELGMKVRLPPWRGFYPSARIGYRVNGTKDISNQRLVMDVGVGVW